MAESNGPTPALGADDTLCPVIIAGVDGSESSIDALRWAARQATLTGATLKVVTTWEWPSTFGWAPPYPDGYSPAHDAQLVLDDAVSKVRAEYPDLAVHVAVVEGHPAPELVKASEGAELLVVGSRGHGEFVGMLIGSVSEHCVTNAHCPVVIVRRGTGALASS